MIFVWTRARVDWDADQMVLAPARAAGRKVVHAPCIEKRPVAGVAPAEPPTDIVVTSMQAADELASQPSLRALTAAKPLIHTHGMATAARLAYHGFLVERHPVRTGEELATRLATTLPRTAQIVVVTAREPAGDIDGLLRDAGLAARRLVCYETIAALTLDPPTRESLAQRGVVCFASPSAARAFAAAVPQRMHLAAAAIGPTTAEALTGYASVHVAKHNDLAALVDAALGGYVSSDEGG